MQTADKLPEQGLALLLVGPPKSRKTSLAMQFPDPYFLDCDNNLNSVTRYYPNKRFWFDRIDIRPDGTEIPVNDRWNYGLQCLKEAASHKDVKTIVIDTLNRYTDQLAEQLVSSNIVGAPKPTNAAGFRTMGQWHWFPFGNVLRALIGDLRTISTEKIVICTVHEKSIKDESTGRVTIQPAIGGQSAELIGGMFTDIWHAETSVDGSGNIKYYVRTLPTPQMTLGNSMGLPAEFNFTWDELVKRMQNSGKKLPKTITT